MPEFTVRLAERTIRVRSIYPGALCLCGDYLADPGAEPDFTVETDPDKIEYERELVAGECSDAYLDALAVYRGIAERMPEYDTLLIHGSAVAVDGEAYLFAAASGTGKSTHTRLWREVFGERAVMVNDDKPLVKIAPSGPIVFGTPWNGKHRLGANIAVPLKAVCLLERAEKNGICGIAPQEAYIALIQRTFRPTAPATLAKTLALVDRLTETVGLYRLGCNMDREAALVSYRGMNADL